jgi:hypothetical protein
MYTSDGLYKEGVVQYSLMSFESMLEIHHLLNASFGTLFRGSKLAQAYSPCCFVGIHGSSIPWGPMSQLYRYQLASVVDDARMVDFGDSHAKRGWAYPTPLLSMLVATTLDPGAHVPTSYGCVVQDYFKDTWFFTANPFMLWPQLAQVDWTQLALR